MDDFPYYLSRLDDMPGLVNRSATLKKRVSMQMRRHIERINRSAGQLGPIVGEYQPCGGTNQDPKGDGGDQ